MSGTRQRIGVLVDGALHAQAAGRESGEAIVRALAETGHDARTVFVDRDLDLALRQGRHDVAFLALRGPQGRDGSVQGLLELLGIPYTGAGLLAAALAANQAKAREVFRLANLPTAPAYVLRADSPRAVLDQHAGFGFPVAVGPADLGAGQGAVVVGDEDGLEAAIAEVFRLSDEALVERFAPGRLVVVAVLDGEALGAADLGATDLGARPSAPKRRASAAQRSTRAQGLARPTRHPALLRMAERSCQALGVEGPALVELVVDDRANEVVRGVDVAPLLAPGSLYARIAASAGLGFAALCETVLEGARVRGGGRRRRSAMGATEPLWWGGAPLADGAALSSASPRLAGRVTLLAAGAHAATAARARVVLPH